MVAGDILCTFFDKRNFETGEKEGVKDAQSQYSCHLVAAFSLC